VSDTPELPPTDAPTEALTRRELRQQQSEVPSEPAAAAKGGGGLRAVIAKHPTAWLASALAVAFLLAGTSALFAGIAVGSSSDAAPLPSESGVAPRTQPSAVPTASVIRTCSIAAAAADPNLADFSGIVLNATTGEKLFDRNGEAPNSTGSVLKVLTAAAGLSALGPDYRFTTKVVEGSAPGSIVLVGGGDATLARFGDNVYPEAPSLDALADQVQAAWESRHGDEPITEVIIDATMWNPDDNWDDSWLRKEQVDGYQSEVTALMVDGDRDDPYDSTSYRSDDPVGRAAAAFVDAMGLNGDATVSYGAASSGQELGSVQSAPLSTLINYMLMTSDNTLAEMMARVVSVSTGLGGSSTSLAQAIPSALTKYGVPVDGLAIRDGSGLSGLNAVPPLYVAQLMTKVYTGEFGLDVVQAGLPVSGVSGSLAGRFTGDNAVAAGSVFAKTGWLDNEYSLGGYITAADGTPLTFAFYAIRDGVGTDYDAGEAAKFALDTLATRTYACGNNTSNN
jgi:D-alanyl-D-alanine carboxypeptidase/D-alanyl-D-alanine-endopeptidase (penicillin-binding protein 4)